MVSPNREQPEIREESLTSEEVERRAQKLARKVLHTPPTQRVIGAVPMSRIAERKEVVLAESPGGKA